VQCPLWTIYMPQGYNMSAPRARRHTVTRPPSFDWLGVECGKLVDEAPRSRRDRAEIAPRSRRGEVSGRSRQVRAAAGCPHRCPDVYMLGLSKLPPRDVARFPPSDERRIVDSIHHGLGIGCERARGAGGGADTYRVASSRGVVPIDRYNVRHSSSSSK